MTSSITPKVEPRDKGQHRKAVVVVGRVGHRVVGRDVLEAPLEGRQFEWKKRWTSSSRVHAKADIGQGKKTSDRTARDGPRLRGAPAFFQ